MILKPFPSALLQVCATMSELVITGILKLAFGFVSDKVRTYAAEKLQDGGLTDQKFRGYVVRELDDIKFKLDANARKDLSTSISCLKQGVQRLTMSLGKTESPSTPGYLVDRVVDDKMVQTTLNDRACSATELKSVESYVSADCGTRSRSSQRHSEIEDRIRRTISVGQRVL